jgi:hypothetical protein
MDSDMAEDGCDLLITNWGLMVSGSSQVGKSFHVAVFPSSEIASWAIISNWNGYKLFKHILRGNKTKDRKQVLRAEVRRDNFEQ